MELLPTFFGLKAFVKNSDTQIKILPSNNTIVYGINKMDSNNFNLCHKIICDIWDWTKQNNIWITADHILGKYNEESDNESRKTREKDKEWMLNKNVFEEIIFAWKLNKQLPVFCIILTRSRSYLCQWKLVFMNSHLFL